MTDTLPYICPICKGVGLIEPPGNQFDETAAKKIMAKALRSHGYSYREIMRLCGWKSPRSAVLACGKDGEEEAEAIINPDVLLSTKAPPQKDERRAKGGHARAESLSPERRSEIARNAANSRWAEAARMVKND